MITAFVILFATTGGYTSPVDVFHYTDMEGCVAAAKYAWETQSSGESSATTIHLTCVPILRDPKL